MARKLLSKKCAAKIINEIVRRDTNLLNERVNRRGTGIGSRKHIEDFEDEIMVTLRQGHKNRDQDGLRRGDFRVDISVVIHSDT